MANAAARLGSGTSDLASVRNDYSSWLDAIFPASRLNDERQGQDPRQQQAKNSRRQQEAEIAQLRDAIPMELPLLAKHFGACRNASKETHAKSFAIREIDGCEFLQTTTAGTNDDGVALTTPSAPQRRKPPPPSKRVSPPCPRPLRSIHRYHGHHSQYNKHHKPAEIQSGVAPVSSAQPHHPATFPHLRYSSRRFPHRPGLNFFDYIPSRAFISVVTTLVFLGTDAAKRAGGDVLWLRTNATGKIQRKIFTAGRFVTDPTFRRRVALSLSGVENQHVCAAAATNRRLRSGAQGQSLLRRRVTPAAGSTFGLSSLKTKQLNPYPAALLKIRRSDERVGSSNSSRSKFNSDSNNSDTTGNGKKQRKESAREGGGRTEVLFLDDVGDIEQALLEAGKEGQDQTPSERFVHSRAAPPQDQQDHQPVPRSSSSGGDGDSGSLSLSREGEGSQNPKTKAAAITPETDTSEMEEDQDKVSPRHPQVEAAPRANLSFSTMDPPMLNTPSGFGRLPSEAAPSVARAPPVERLRPWAIQKYLRSKGPLAWMVRVVWRRNQGSFCWIISDTDPFVTSELSFDRGDGFPARLGSCTAVRSIAGHPGWEAPKAFVANLVSILESSESSAPSGTPSAMSSSNQPRFGEFVADLIIDDSEGKWWLTQVKGFRLLRVEPLASRLPFPKTAPSGSAALSILASEASTTHGRRRGSAGQGCGNITIGDGEYVENSTKNEESFFYTETGTLTTRASRAKMSGTPPGGFAGDHLPSRTSRFVGSRGSSCPGLFCNNVGGGKRGEAWQWREETTGRMPPAEEGRTRSDADRACYGEKRAGKDRAVTLEKGESTRRSPVQNVELIELEKPGLEDDDMVGEGEDYTNDGTGGDEFPMLQLPLKALVMYAEVVRLRNELLDRERTAAEAEAGAVSRGEKYSTHTSPVRISAHNKAVVSAGKGRNTVLSLHDTSLMESRALAALRQRDRVLLYDNVPLCAACYREYGDNWRWWLARGAEAAGRAPSQANAGDHNRSRPDQSMEGERRRRTPSRGARAVADAGRKGDTAAPATTVASGGGDGGGGRKISTVIATKVTLSNHTVTRTNNVSNAPLSSWLSSKVVTATEVGVAICETINTANVKNIADAHTSSCHQNIEAKVDHDKQQRQPDEREAHREGHIGKQGSNSGNQRGKQEEAEAALTPTTSTADTFRAKLDRRLEEIHILPFSFERSCGMENGGIGARPGGGPTQGPLERASTSPPPSSSPMTFATRATAEAVATEDLAPAMASTATKKTASVGTSGNQLIASSCDESAPDRRAALTVGGRPAAGTARENDAIATTPASSEQPERSQRNTVEKPARPEKAIAHANRRNWDWENVKVDWEPYVSSGGGNRLDN